MSENFNPNAFKEHTGKTVKCTKHWLYSTQLPLIRGGEYTIVYGLWQNNEDHWKLEGKDGKVFEAPCDWFDEPH